MQRERRPSVGVWNGPLASDRRHFAPMKAANNAGPWRGGSSYEMAMSSAAYSVSRFPDSRLATIDLGQVGRRKHHVAALVELDVTPMLTRVHESRSRGEETSFFASFLATAAKVIAEEPSIQALGLGKTSLLAFNDVDISAMVEREFEGTRIPLPVLLRDCNKKTAAEIHQEIQAAKTAPIDHEGDFVLGAVKRQQLRLRLYYALPGWLRPHLLRWLTKDPFRAKREMGTVVVTSLGSLARVPGWFIPKSMHNLCFALGAIVKKPWVVDGRVEVRDILHLTLLFNHDVVDGAPAARFLSRLASALERRDG